MYNYGEVSCIGVPKLSVAKKKKKNYIIRYFPHAFATKNV